jgi:putative ABC transport system ATP-binding protein
VEPRDEVAALDDVDLTVADGEIVALVGPSGSGKTTLCSIAGGILTPTDGRIGTVRPVMARPNARAGRRGSPR